MDALPINPEDLHRDHDDDGDHDDDDDDDDVSFHNFDCVVRQITSSHKEHAGTTLRLIMSPWRPMDGAEPSEDRKLE